MMQHYAKVNHDELMYLKVVDIASFFKMGMMRHVSVLPDRINGTKLNLGAGKKIIVGTHSLDYPEWNGESEHIPHGDETVELIHAYHFLEHLADPIPCLFECQRVLLPGAHMNIVVPYWNSQLAFADTDHKSFYTEKTFPNMLSDYYHSKGKLDRFQLAFQLIMGINGHNLALFVQLQKKI